MKALVTGASGFVGGHLTKELLKNNYEVYGASLLSHNDLFVADFTNFGEVRSLIQRVNPEVIFHLAAIAFVPASWKNPEFVFKVNTLGTLNLFEAVRSLGIDPVIVSVGSSEEYGLVLENELPIKETNPLRPLSPYAVSKIGMDFLGYQYFKSYGMKIVRTRAFNHEGYGRGPQYMTSSFAKQIVEIKYKKRSVIKHGDLSSKRDITDVRDTVRAYRLASELCEHGEVYNIGSGNLYSAEEILKTLIRISGVKVKTEIDPDRLRPSDVKILQSDSTKFKEKTGWKPKYNIKQTLSEELRFWEEYYGKK